MIGFFGVARERDTYQVAHYDLALSSGPGSLAGRRLGGRAARRLGVLLDTAYGSRGSGTSGLAGGATTTGRSALVGGEDLVERLVELARHVDVGDECVGEISGFSRKNVAGLESRDVVRDS